MEKSKVYFTDMRCPAWCAACCKSWRSCIYAAGIEIKLTFDGKFAAIKIHFGEPGNLSFLRPNFSKVRGRCGERIGWETLS